MTVDDYKNIYNIAFEDGFNYALEHLERKCPHFMYSNDMECMWYKGYDSALKSKINYKYYRSSKFN